MRVRQTVMAAILCLSSVGLVQARSHSITLSEPTMAGDVQLPPGNYEVKLEGNSALLTNVDKDKTYSAPVKVESEPDKYKQTALLTGQQGGESYIQAIEFGGSHTRLVFGE